MSFPSPSHSPRRCGAVSEKYRREHFPTLADLGVNRREFLQRTGMGFGALSLAWLLGANSAAAQTAPAGKPRAPLAPRPPHFPAPAKAVIHIFAKGGPSQVDTWDPKPALLKYAGKTIEGHDGLVFPSPFKFSKHGQAGTEVSELFPRLGGCVDDMAVIRSIWTDIPAHDVAQRFWTTGSLQMPAPSMGSWVVYGLGTENQNMPGFITLGGKPEARQASFLPGVFEGCNVNYTHGMRLDQVLLNIRNEFTGLERQRRQLDLARKLNEIHAAALQRDAQLESRIETFEMAFKMQTEATDAFDLSKESAETRALYGETDMGGKMLIARRLIERGVRFVQVEHDGWDSHSNLASSIPLLAETIDRPAAALLQDLKQRGLLASTLVLWGGEFGRAIVRDRNGNEGGPGRDHNARASVAWMAGGGVKAGIVHGATDELGDRAVEGKVHIHDLHATVLALLGFDHTKLTHHYNGRD
ncbi:MAG: DUF1501 domain-containing protein, partial [Opitutaceae bacterium]